MTGTTESTDGAPQIPPTPPANAFVRAAQDAVAGEVIPPTYKKPHEVRAARAAYGHHYDRMVARAEIIAPTREELSDDDIAKKLADEDAEREAKSAKKVAREQLKEEGAPKKAAKKAAARKRGRK